MKKTATISAILAVVGFMAVYVALCYLVPGWRLKLHATAWVYFAASLRHMALLKGVFAMAAGLVLATLPFLGMLRERLPYQKNRKTRRAVGLGGAAILILHWRGGAGGGRRPPARRAGQRTKFAAMAEPSGLRP